MIESKCVNKFLDPNVISANMGYSNKKIVFLKDFWTQNMESILYIKSMFNLVIEGHGEKVSP